MNNHPVRPGLAPRSRAQGGYDLCLSLAVLLKLQSQPLLSLEVSCISLIESHGADWLMDGLIDWLIAWLVDWLIGWLVDWLIYWLVSWLLWLVVCLFVCLCVCLLYNTLSFSLQRKAKRYITYIIYHMKTVKAKVKYCQLQGSGELSCRTLENFASTVQIWQLESMTRSPITCT